MTWGQRNVSYAIALALMLAAGEAHAQSAPFRDCSDCPEMVVILPGAFVMGVPSGEEEREHVLQQFRGWSVPQHRVTISRGFALGKYTVTRAEFAAFARETGYQTPNHCWVFDRNTATNQWRFVELSGYDWRSPGFAQTERDPVVCVRWDDAKAYAAWLSRKTGKLYGLPTEAEWEYAARAGSPSARFWGDDRSQACRYANVADLTMFSTLNLRRNAWDFNCSDGFTHTAPVGSFEPNAFGLYDMLGNAWQWTGDCWNENYQGAPTDGSAWTLGDCSRRVGRGGSWGANPRLIRVGHRGPFETEHRATDCGFRVATSLPEVLELRRARTRGDRRTESVGAMSDVGRAARLRGTAYSLAGGPDNDARVGSDPPKQVR